MAESCKQTAPVIRDSRVLRTSTPRGSLHTSIMTSSKKNLGLALTGIYSKNKPSQR